MRTIEHDELTEKIIGAAIEVHRALGPGLLESAYEGCLCHAMRLASLNFARQQPLPVIYKNIHLDCGYRMDLVVEGRVVVELKTADRLLPIHYAQLLPYLHLAGIRTGLILNFNVPALRDGIKRVVL